MGKKKKMEGVDGGRRVAAQHVEAENKGNELVRGAGVTLGTKTRQRVPVVQKTIKIDMMT